jgi:iron complex transport system substrate-binding protein
VYLPFYDGLSLGPSEHFWKPREVLLVMGLIYRAKLLFVPALSVLVLLTMACGSDDVPTQVASDVATDTPATAAVVATEVPTTPTAIPTATPPPAPTVTPVPMFPFTVTGSNGREITFYEAPERIVAIDSAVVETLFAIGEGWRVVGTHDFVSHPLEAEDIERVGGAFNLNLEATVGLDPDLVFVFSEGLVEELERLGLRVLYLQSLRDDFRVVADNVRMWGDIVGNPVAAGEVAANFEARVAAIERAMAGRDEGPRVFQDEGELWTPGPDTLIGQVFEVLKLQNIAYDVDGYSQLSPEVIVERAPEIVIAAYGDSISANPAFAELPAVKDGRVYVPDSDALSIPGLRYVVGLEKLARWVYPDLFD